VKVLASRNTEVLTSVWDTTRSLMLAPGPSENPGMFIRAPAGAASCQSPLAAGSANDVAVAESLPSLRGKEHGSGRVLCNSSWTCDYCGRPPAPTEVPYGKLYWNWTDPSMPDTWLNRHVLPPVVDACTVEVESSGSGSTGTMTLPCFDGVYWDCSCGTIGVPKDDMPAFMGAAQNGFNTHLSVFSKLSKASLSWAGEGIDPSKCTADMARLSLAYGPASALYNDTTMQLKWDLNPATFNYTINAFQILRPSSALLMF